MRLPSGILCHSLLSGVPRLDSHGSSCIFGDTRRSLSSFAKALEDTRCAFLHGFLRRRMKGGWDDSEIQQGCKIW
jgi:hypothetical protein